MKDILVEAARAGVRLESVGDELRVSAPPGALGDELRRSLARHKDELVRRLRASGPQGQGAAGPDAAPLRPDDAARHEPFPLTALQHAYWVGRSGSIEMGGTSAHYYVEFDSRGLDIGRLGQALDLLVRRHGMLRAVVGRDGLQRVLPEVPAYEMAVSDCTGAEPADAEARALATRDELSHQLFEPGRWPMFDIRATLLPAGRQRLHVSLDLLLFDVGSLLIFFRDWHALYLALQEGSPDPLPPIDVAFRDHVLDQARRQGGPAHQRAERYWMGRIDSLPPGPSLPVRQDRELRRSARFTRRSSILGAARWQRLQQACRERGLTPSNALLALYAEVLARWSAAPHFCVNATVSERPASHPHIDRVLGDFTVPLLHEVDLRGGPKPFAERALEVQRRFIDDLEHRSFDGTRVLREWARRHGVAMQTVAPVVFTSALGWAARDGDPQRFFGDEAHAISQTPQVWLDHHLLERAGEMVCIWDAAEALFHDGVLDAMFDAYRAAIARLADEPSAWGRADLVELPTAMRGRRAAFNRTAAPLPAGGLHAGLVDNARAWPDRPAVIAPDRVLGYGELLAEAAAVADGLLARPAGPVVAVLMRKGWRQVVAAHGALLAGRAYLPVDADLPLQRQLELLRAAKVPQVLVEPGGRHTELATLGCGLLTVDGERGVFSARHEASLRAGAGDLAYVIFTSGSTGTPKGVMVDHRAAKNTVTHVNHLLGLAPGDRVLGLSSLGFDLSVYDIFGTHAAGAALVLPEAARHGDPGHWRELMRRHGVTVWNSAPQLMRMLTELPGDSDPRPSALRAALLSGDFIPVDLPARVRVRHPGARVISLGGATEASIWSIFHPVERVDPDAVRIPYGRPLPNQSVQVLDAWLRPRPDGVVGRIHIGGAGLARGYWRDDRLTAERFVADPATGERLYDTGDLGFHGEDGEVVILGRDDRQVKLRGHRVEPAETEAWLRRHPSVRQAVAVVRGDGDGRRLVAYVVFAQDAGEQAPAALKDFLAQRLPDAMVPAGIVAVPEIPLSANGKVDPAALAALEGDGGAGRACVPPRDDVERAIHAVWKRLLPEAAAFGVTDDFFSLGGDSMSATALVRELSAELPGLRLEVHELFEQPSVAGLAALYRQRGSPGTGDAQCFGGTLPDPSAALADLAAVRAAWADAAPAPPAAPPPSQPRAVLLTGATGWVGSQLLSALLSSTTARVYCLIRDADEAAALARLAGALQSHGLALPDDWRGRVLPVRGDLAAPGFGWPAAVWERLAREVDAVHHLGASLNLLADYAALREVNVLSASTLLRFASEGAAKRVFALSPMAVCRRWRQGGLQLLTGEEGHADPEGLMTAYALSKWAAEGILLGARRRGLEVTVYRTAHALPSQRLARVKPGDTYAAVLRVARAAGLVPDWPQSRLQGVPVDRLAALMVEDSLRGGDRGHGVVHIDNQDACSLGEVLRAMLGDAAPQVPRPQWLAACRAAAAAMPGPAAGLAQGLFAERATGVAVENMFAALALETGHFDRLGLRGRLAGLTPPAYWRRLGEGPLGAAAGEAG